MSEKPTRVYFELAAKANARDLLAYFERRLGSGTDAADALSDVLLAAWRHHARLPRDPVEARMWLFGIARNVLLNARRGERRRSAALERLRGEAELSQEIVQQVEPDGLREAVRETINGLPETQAELVRLVHWEGFKLVEAAKIVDVPSSTARSRYAAALTSMRNQLSLAVDDVPADV